ncbi:hypothetical protein Tsubulata_031159, partial [Turnera subulata]
MELINSSASCSLSKFVLPKLHNRNGAASNPEILHRNSLHKSTPSVSVIKAAAGGGGGGGSAAETAVVVKDQPKQQRLHYEISPGLPAPFGATYRDGGVNFAVYSANAVSATLCLISLSDLPRGKVTEAIYLDPAINK